MMNRSNRMSDGSPNPIDIHVGARVRERRIQLGMSQGVLGTALGLTFQQVQKYERGANRVSASRLFDLCRALDVPVQYFFEGTDVAISSAAHVAAECYGPEHSRALMELAKVYVTLSAPLRGKIVEIARIMAATP